MLFRSRTETTHFVHYSFVVNLPSLHYQKAGKTPEQLEMIYPCKG